MSNPLNVACSRLSSRWTKFDSVFFFSNLCPEGSLSGMF
jgi:hypothetical protein